MKMRFKDMSDLEKMDALVLTGKVDKEFALKIKKSEEQEIKEILYRLFMDTKELVEAKENHPELKKLRETLGLINSGFRNVKTRIQKQIDYITYECNHRKNS